MNEDNSIVQLRQPDAIDDPLTALLRSGARRLLEQAIEAEVEAFLASKKDLRSCLCAPGEAGAIQPVEVRSGKGVAPAR